MSCDNRIENFFNLWCKNIWCFRLLTEDKILHLYETQDFSKSQEKEFFFGFDKSYQNESSSPQSGKIKFDFRRVIAPDVQLTGFILVFTNKTILLSSDA